MAATNTAVSHRPVDNAAIAGTKILITAGERDPICPPALTKALAGYFERQKAAVTTEWHPGGHDIRQNEIEAMHRLFG